MAKDENTYGFNKDDATSLVASISSPATSYSEGRPRGGGIRLVRFALTASLASGTASATIKDMAGATIDTDDVLDPEAIFDELDTGDTGLAIAQGGKYYVIQASCGVV
jgi:hypothetical protein